MDFLTQSINLFHKGGPVMYVLALCSFAVVTISVERFLFYRSMTTDAQGFLLRLKPLLEKQRFAEVLQLCEQTPQIAGQLTGQGLLAYQRGHDVEAALEYNAMVTASRLRAYLNYLSSIVTLSPLLGLLGTVIGMIHSFSVFNVQSGQPLAITGGVGEALVATAAGLSVAILALVAHTYFSHWLDTLVTDMEQISTSLLQYISGKKTVRRDSHEIA